MASGNDLNDLFARIDADPTMPHPGDIDKLITYYRELRATKGQPKGRAKAKAEVEPAINLAEIGLAPKPKVVSIRRRI